MYARGPASACLSVESDSAEKVAGRMGGAGLHRMTRPPVGLSDDIGGVEGFASTKVRHIGQIRGGRWPDSARDPFRLFRILAVVPEPPRLHRARVLTPAADLRTTLEGTWHHLPTWLHS